VFQGWALTTRQAGLGKIEISLQATRLLDSVTTCVFRAEEIWLNRKEVVSDDVRILASSSLHPLYLRSTLMTRILGGDIFSGDQCMLFSSHALTVSQALTRVDQRIDVH
jgi:hypothetical protein